MQIKVEGVASDEADKLAKSADMLVQAGIQALICFYSAPEGPTGDSQRENADAVIRRTSRQAVDVCRRKKGLGEITREAQTYKGDFLDWIAAIEPPPQSSDSFA